MRNFFKVRCHTASNIIHRIRTGLFYDMSQTIKKLLLSRFFDNTDGKSACDVWNKSFIHYLSIIHCNFFIQVRADLTTTKSDDSFLTKFKNGNIYHKHSLIMYLSIFTCTILYLLWLTTTLLLCGDIEVNPGPCEYSLDSDGSSECITNSLDLMLENSTSLVYLNIQSINDKLEFIQAEFSGFDIITLNETWFNKNTSSQDILIPGFKEPFRRDREEYRRWGGDLCKKSYSM